MRTDAQSNGKPCRIIKGMVKDNVVYRKNDCMELVARHHGELGLEVGSQNTQRTARYKVQGLGFVGFAVYVWGLVGDGSIERA